MQVIGSYIRLVRPVNLAIIILTQALFWYYIVEPVYAFFELAPHLTGWQVWLLIASTVLIAAGGYVINDYYDLPIDLVNKPDKVIISRDVGDTAAFNYYMALTGAGLLSALAVAWWIGKPTLVLLPLIIASLLWFYAQTFKRVLLVGNFVIAFSTAAVIFILLLFEIEWVSTTAALPPEVNEILKFGSAYMVFAFLMTMVREAVKDLQDMQGDAEFECRTMPIVWGELTAKSVTLLWLLSVTGLLGWLIVSLVRFSNYLAAGYIAVCLIIPGMAAGYRVLRARGPRDYAAASAWIKGMMLAGVLTMIYIGIILGKHG